MIGVRSIGKITVNEHVISEIYHRPFNNAQMRVGKKQQFSGKHNLTDSNIFSNYN